MPSQSSIEKNKAIADSMKATHLKRQRTDLSCLQAKNQTVKTDIKAERTTENDVRRSQMAEE